MAKKRANGEGSIRRKPNGRWEGRYTLGIDPATGRAIQKSVSAKTRAECKEKLDRAIRDNRGIPMDHNEDYTVAEWCRLWFETYSKPVIRPNTAKNYRNIIENHIVPAIGMVKLKRLTAIQIQQMYNNSKAKGRVQRFETQTNAALSGSTVRRIHMVLSSALKQAVKERIIPYNPCDNCRIPRKEHREMTIIPPEKLGVYRKSTTVKANIMTPLEMEDYLDAAERLGYLPMFMLALTAGLRQGELIALKWSDLNMKKRTLTIAEKRAVERRELVEYGSQTRSIRLTPEVVDLLIMEHSKHPSSPLMFMHPATLKPYSPQMVRRMHKEIIIEAGLDHIRFTDLRHTCAIASLRNGMEAKELAQMLGHARTSMTRQNYTPYLPHKKKKDGESPSEASQAELKQAANILDNLLKF